MVITIFSINIGLFEVVAAELTEYDKNALASIDENITIA